MKITEQLKGNCPVSDGHKPRSSKKEPPNWMAGSNTVTAKKATKLKVSRRLNGRVGKKQSTPPQHIGDDARSHPFGFGTQILSYQNTPYCIDV
ncbi:hypothetical protein V6N13_002847 [Hibiscus sabdariffa]